MELAQRLEIHPAIVAGRVRYETKNFRLLSQFVGTGEVRRQLLSKEAVRHCPPNTSTKRSPPRLGHKKAGG
jgi:hypothetical protein